MLMRINYFHEMNSHHERHRLNGAGHRPCGGWQLDAIVIATRKKY